MIQGLLWLPLLMVFFALAWAGKREFKKIEVYRQWSSSFSNAKYDIYSVLGVKEEVLVWGKPTYKGIVEEQTIPLNQITDVKLISQGKIVNLTDINLTGSASISLSLKNGDSIVIPFTQISLAAQWARDIEEKIKELILK